MISFSEVAEKLIRFKVAWLTTNLNKIKINFHYSYDTKGKKGGEISIRMGRVVISTWFSFLFVCVV